MPSPPHSSPADLVCFSHLRWDFVYQRPQHLMSRFAEVRRVHYVEEPVFQAGAHPHLSVTSRRCGVKVVVPVLPDDLDERAAVDRQRALLQDYVAGSCAVAPTFWFVTPTAFAFSPNDRAGVVIYDCMDELTAFDGAPPALLFNEKQLFARADLVFTGGRALYEAKRALHPHVRCFPSSIDQAHFRRARAYRQDALRPAVAESKPSMRVGYSGVVDERMDLELLADVADARPDFQFVIVGPVVKIDAGKLPRRSNIRFDGMRSYGELPELMSEWDVAIMPFAHNAATRYISPTKTPEYLAAGLPVVSTGIHDVVRRYGNAGLVHIAEGAEAFAEAIDEAGASRDDATRLIAVDALLGEESWETTWASMAALERAVQKQPDSGVTDRVGDGR